MNSPLGSRYAIGSALGRSVKRESAATGGRWDLFGTLTSCVAAYQPKGAASYALSKVNLASPGTYNATDGTAYPSWDASYGWRFTRANSQYLNSNYATPDGVCTAVIRTGIIGAYSNAAIIALRKANQHFGFYNFMVGDYIGIRYGNASGVQNTNLQEGGIDNQTFGVVGTGTTTYCYKGKTKSNVYNYTFSATNTDKMFIGAENFAGVGVFNFLEGDIYSLYIYNTELSTAQYEAVVDAMATL